MNAEQVRCNSDNDSFSATDSFDYKCDDKVVRYENGKEVEYKYKPRPIKRKPIRNRFPKVGRNDLCPCQSGKKFKKCCMVKG